MVRGLFYGWVIIAAAAIIMFGVSGARFSFGIFIRPLQQEFGWDRAALAGAASINLLLSGLLRPAAGYLADRYGPKLVALAGVAVAAVALGSMPFVQNIWHMYLVYTLLGISLATSSLATLAPLAARWFERQRGLALSILSAGTAAGEVLIVPGAMLVLLLTDWRTTYTALAVLLGLVILPVGLLLIRNDPEALGLRPDGDSVARAAAAAAKRAYVRDVPLREAVRTPVFWQLSFGYAVCGFTMAFANTHMAVWAMDMGFSELMAAGAVGLIGGFSIAGALIFGWLSDHLTRKNLLAFVYLLRGAAFLVLLRVGLHDESLLFLGAAVLGFSWTATVPLTTAIVADHFGRRALATIAGTMFAVMPLATALGAWLGGFVYDQAHDYILSLAMSAVAGLLASVVVFACAPAPRPAPAAEGVAALSGGSE
ncbi:MAG: MFS transporter [Chloroflexi bacterium]|nr:MFS transporter [Chloroflexota bacterium]MBI4507893.1 MFS transporter [Chloroflexota bacterium]